MRDFRKYSIWQESFGLVKEVYQVVNQLPSQEKFGLASQMSRSAVSVPSNIAEGCARNSDVEFKRFLEIALGSSFELETQLLLCVDLQFADSESIQQLIENIHRNQAGINSLIQKIKSSTR
jgi:four helix bundle protein